MKLTYGGCSSAGLVRAANEDSYLARASERGGLFLVADGIGGMAHGEMVSGMLRDSYDRWWRDCFLPAERTMEFQTAMEGLKGVLREQNQEALRQFGPMKAGSTLALLFLFQGRCLYLSVGDSRIYRRKGFSFRQVTMDDVYENLPGQGKNPSARLRGKLVSAVGIRPAVDFTLRTDVLRARTRFLVCSDGVHRYIAPQDLRRRMIFDGAAPERLLRLVSERVERNGARDNYTMIYVRVNAL